jgi:hypothetical protein
MRLRITLVLLAESLTVTTLLGAAALPAAAAPGDGVLSAVTSLIQVMTNIELWLGGLLGGLATLLATVGGLRYLLAAGDPGEVMKAKETLKYAAVGYAVAVLAPLLVSILKGFVGG